MTYPTIRAWYAHVNNLTNAARLNDAQRELRRGERTTCGIHNFKQTGDMGRAVKALQNRATMLPVYPVHGGEWRDKSEAMLEFEARDKATPQPITP